MLKRKALREDLLNGLFSEPQPSDAEGSTNTRCDLCPCSSPGGAGPGSPLTPPQRRPAADRQIPTKRGKKRTHKASKCTSMNIRDVVKNTGSFRGSRPADGATRYYSSRLRSLTPNGPLSPPGGTGINSCSSCPSAPAVPQKRKTGENSAVLCLRLQFMATSPFWPPHGNRPGGRHGRADQHLPVTSAHLALQSTS